MARTTLVLTPFVIVWIGWSVAVEKGCEVSQQSLLRPLKICSPFGSRTLLSTAEYAALLKLPLFPEATGVKQVTSSWDANTLSFLELTSSSPLADVERWYENALGPAFRKSEGTCASFELPGQEWMQRVLEDCIGTGALFLAGDHAGVLLSSPEPDRRVLRLWSRK